MILSATLLEARRERRVRQPARRTYKMSSSSGWALQSRVEVEWADDEYFEGVVDRQRTALGLDDCAYTEFHVTYDDGASCWHDPTEWKCRPAPQQGGDAFFLPSSDWVMVSPRCQLSLAPLVDPTKGDMCKHRTTWTIFRMRFWNGMMNFAN